MAIQTIIRNTIYLEEPISKKILLEPLANNDDQAHRFEARVLRDNERIDLTGASVNGYFVRPGGETVILPGGVENGIAYVVLTSACYAVPGRFSFAMKVQVNGVRHTVVWYEGAVGQAMTDSYVDTEHVIPSLDELLAQIDAAELAAERASKAAEEAETMLESAEQFANMTATATILQAGSNPTASYNDGVLTLGLPKGQKGDKGDSGVGIQSVETKASLESGGTNTVTLHMTDLTDYSFNVKNGKDGKDGADGSDGLQGNDGLRGRGILKITTTPSTYTTTVNGFTPSYRISKATVISQAVVDYVLTGDILLCSTKLYPVGRVDDTYVYCGPSVELRGSTGYSSSITKVTASVDDGVGTPSVTATRGGTTTAATFDFAFKNLKGADGVGIANVEQTTTSLEDGGINIITVTKTDGSTSLFSVRNGNKPAKPTLRKIHDVTINEEGYDQFHLDGLNLQYIHITITSPAFTAASGVYVYPYSGDYVLPYNFTTTANSAWYASALVDRRQGALVTEGFAYTSDTSMRGLNGVGQRYINNALNSDEKKITRLMLKVHSGDLKFPVGTRILVMGIDAE